MPTFEEAYRGIIAALVDRYGRPGQAPRGHDDDPFARVLAASLDRAVEARKVEATLEALREASLLEPRRLAEADPSEITETIRQARVAVPAQALRVLQRLARWVVDRHEGSLETLEEVPTSELREELLALNGIGPATADAILLTGLRRAVYPVDRATYRILVRHGWLDPTAEYEEARDLVERQGGEDPEALSQLSTWLARVGREACRATVAKCDRCPLKPFLPEGGPRDPE